MRNTSMGRACLGALRSRSMMAGSSLRSPARRSRSSFSSFRVGQLAVPQQVAGFFEGGMVGEFVNVDAAVGQDALISVDVADAGGGGDNSFQAFGGCVAVRLDIFLAREFETPLWPHGEGKWRVQSQLTFIRQNVNFPTGRGGQRYRFGRRVRFSRGLKAQSADTPLDVFLALSKTLRRGLCAEC